MSLYSDCCGAADRLFKRVLDMSHADMGICPNCGEHCSFSNDELMEELKEAAKGKDLISVTIKKAIADKASHTEIFDYIKSQAKDNLRIMADVLGIELTEKILAV
jgi:phage-related protein